MTIRGLKGAQRESHQPRWRGYLDGPALLKLKREATLLYAVRARTRGRVHAPTWEATREAEIADFLARFQRASAPPVPTPHAA